MKRFWFEEYILLYQGPALGKDVRIAPWSAHRLVLDMEKASRFCGLVFLVIYERLVESLVELAILLLGSRRCSFQQI